MHEARELMEIGPYLDRIRYNGPLEPTPETLRRLHRAHMLAVPFENFDVAMQRPIELSLDVLFDKIVRRKRGGFCYELNGLFWWLLRTLGFDVVMVSARVIHDALPGPEFDHMVLCVSLNEAVIADVGFGDSFLEPVPLDGERPVLQQGCEYRVVGADAMKVLERRQAGRWEPQYTLTTTARRLDEFRAMCRHHQTSPESPFTRKTVCSIATDNGRTTLSNNRLILNSGKGRVEKVVSDEAEYRSLLALHFGIEFDRGTPVERLIIPQIPPE